MYIKELQPSQTAQTHQNYSTTKLPFLYLSLWLPSPFNLKSIKIHCEGTSEPCFSCPLLLIRTFCFCFLNVWRTLTGSRVLMENLPRGIFYALLLFLWVCAVTASVTYDHKAILVNGKRRILISGSIHYPRSTPEVLIKTFHFLHWKAFCFSILIVSGGCRCGQTLFKRQKMEA